MYMYIYIYIYMVHTTPILHYKSSEAINQLCVRNRLHLNCYALTALLGTFS